MDAIKQRFLTDRVLTATPAQRVVMLYDRLSLDLIRARNEVDGSADAHLEHASLIVAELAGSLDHSVEGPTANLASLYAWMLGELLKARLGGAEQPDLEALEANVRSLREAWAMVAAEVATASVTASVTAAAFGATSGPPALAAAWTA